VASCDKCVTQRTGVVNCPFGWVSAHFRAVEVFGQMGVFEFVIYSYILTVISLIHPLLSITFTNVLYLSLYLTIT
jgi:hypothetical protein